MVLLQNNPFEDGGIGERRSIMRGLIIVGAESLYHSLVCLFKISLIKVLLERVDINEINIMERINQMKNRFFDKIMKLSQKYKVCGFIGFGNCIYTPSNAS